MILANKCDMNDRRQVSLERGAAVSFQLSVSLSSCKLTPAAELHMDPGSCGVGVANLLPGWVVQTAHKASYQPSLRLVVYMFVVTSVFVLMF